MRTCKICGKEIKNGEPGYYAAGDYYCSDECLSKDFTKEEWEQVYDDDSDEFYWTIFED